MANGILIRPYEARDWPAIEAIHDAARMQELTLAHLAVPRHLRVRRHLQRRRCLAGRGLLRALMGQRHLRPLRRFPRRGSGIIWLIRPLRRLHGFLLL